MPLKLRKRADRPHYEIRGTYLGRHVEQSTGSGKRAVAQKVLRDIERQIERSVHDAPNETTFADAALAYMNAGGERTHITKLLEYFGATPLSKIDQSAIDNAALHLFPDRTPARRNRAVYTPVSAVLRRAGISIILKRPKGSSGNKQTAWLWPQETEALFAEAEKIDPRFAALLIVLCYTGLRLSEALNLTWNDVKLEEAFAYVAKTKNENPRPVFLPPVAVAALANLPGERDSQSVFGWRKTSHIYDLLDRVAAAAGITLPERSAFHIFRHTFATWMRRYAGADEQSLIATGAWKDPKSVKRYTHTVVSEEARKAELLPTPRRTA